MKDQKFHNNKVSFFYRSKTYVNEVKYETTKKERKWNEKEMHRQRVEVL